MAAAGEVRALWRILLRWFLFVSQPLQQQQQQTQQQRSKRRKKEEMNNHATKLQPSTAVRRTGLLLCSFVFYEIYIQSTLIARPTILSTSVVRCPCSSSGLFQ